MLGSAFQTGLLTFLCCFVAYFLSGRRQWIVSVLHSIAATCVASLALATGQANNEMGQHSIAISCAYFFYDFLVEWAHDANSTIAFMLHHVLGISTALLFLASHSDITFVYVWLQTNECSTPFLYGYKELKIERSRFVFAFLFLVSRIIINFWVIYLVAMPMLHGRVLGRAARREEETDSVSSICIRCVRVCVRMLMRAFVVCTYVRFFACACRNVPLAFGSAILRSPDLLVRANYRRTIEILEETEADGLPHGISTGIEYFGI